MTDQSTPADSPRRSQSLTRWVGITTAIVVALAVLAAGIIPALLPDRAESNPAPVPVSEEDLGEGADRFTEQAVDWYACENGMECADVAAPMDWDDLRGETITLRLTKQPALAGDPTGSLFVNPGGPGASGAAFVADSIDFVVGADLQDEFDVIGWDPRGVGDSSAVSCFDAAGMDEYLFGDPREYADLEAGSDAWLEIARAESTELGDACLERTGGLLEFVDTQSTVQDLDLLRHLVGDASLNYLGFSYGTFIGALYADAFPENVGRMVLDGALAPEATMHDVVLEQTKGFEQATRTYLTACLETTDCPFRGTVDDAMNDIETMIDALQSDPIQASDGRWVSSGVFLTAIITPLYSQDSWPFLNQLFATMQEGDPDVALTLADFYYGRTSDGRYEDNSTEAFWAINCLDYPSQGDVDVMRQQARELEQAAPTFGSFQGYGDVGCAGWPFAGNEDRGPVTGTGAEPILVIGTTGDPATPYLWAEDLAGQLESGVLVTYNGEGHTAYGASANACVTTTVESYFLSGTVPTSDPQC